MKEWISNSQSDTGTFIPTQERTLMALFDGDESDTVSSPKEDVIVNDTPSKIVFKGKEYTEDEMSAIIASAENEKRWRAELAKKGELLNKERESISEWNDFIQVYASDPQLQAYIKKYSPDEIEENQILEEVIDDQEGLVKIVRQQKEQIKKQGDLLNELISSLSKKEELEIQGMVVKDAEKVKDLIKKEGAPFSFEDVRDIANDGESMTYSQAYMLLKGQNIDKFIEQKKREIEKETIEKYRNTSPPVSPVIGQGIAGLQKNWTSFSDAAENAKKKYAGKLWK